MPKVSGEVLIMNKESEYGFIVNLDIGAIFFSSKTNYRDTSFKNLKNNDKVSVEVVDTPEGFFATSLEKFTEKERPHEAAL
ncbi:MAG: cold shock domain-containing protein [Bdellovibrionales bacterium]|jgi:cold shock CspA family protein|nr:cold shock domain-containing protein [Bdellovibrionales bacterium]MBT3526974.1 cold shock domain-containing protein [Bdellovibrionales bacterium]MBT7668124.1 cold shock domain-containing protein [Bdellovibrionales bacterium]MBT7767042.1 cold shock domain-containing protein [Bdellovibrionales bacterium]